MMSDEKNLRRFPRHTREVKFDGDVKIYDPKNITPVFETYVVTDNYTADDGNVYNHDDENIKLSKHWVDENHK